MADCESQWKTPEWKTPAFRNKIVAQIDEAIRQSGNPINKNPGEMESHVFNKAKTKDEYLSFVARLILHVREMNSSNKQANQGPPIPSGMPIGSSPNPDPINALQSMARQEGPLAYFPGPNMQLSQALNNQNPHMGSSLATQNPQLGAALANQPPPGAAAAANAIAHAAAAGMGMGGHPGLGPQPQGMQQGGFQSMVVGMPGRGQMVPNVTLPMPKAVMKQQQVHAKAMQQVMQQGQPPNMPPPIKPGGQMQAINEAVMMQREQVQQVSGAGQFVQQNTPPIPRQGTPTQFPRQSPSPQVPGHMGMVPSPAQQQQMPPSLSAQMTPSPAAYLPSQSPHIIPSPAAAPSVGSQSAGRTPGTIGAPSPGSALNTPMATGAVPSPISRSQEDQAYFDKVKQLSKYIEPLKRMIARIDNDEDKKKDRSKMKNLLDILSNPTKRLQMDTLLKCEQVLEKMELKVKSGEPPAVVPSKEYNLCQPLYEAICAHINLPTFSHTLQRTFGPAVASLHGERFHRSPPLKKKKFDDDMPDIPDILQGEIARLDRRFKVTLNPIQHSGSRTVHLICQLDDKNLPCVPPITLTVPENYPQQAPCCDATSDDYESTQFLQTIHANLLARLSKMPDQFSITSLLDTWEMSVRQACSPILTVGNESTE